MIDETKTEEIDKLMAMADDVKRGKDKIDRYRPPPVTNAQRTKNKKILRRLIITGMADEEIFEIMSQVHTPAGKPGPNMASATTRQMMDEIYAEMAEEADERKPYLKIMAQHRIHSELRSAVKDRSWSAVANLEKVLSGIEGTQEPLEVKVEAGARLTEAIMAKLGETDTAKIRELIERGKRLQETNEEPVKIKEIEITPINRKDSEQLDLKSE